MATCLKRSSKLFERLGAAVNNSNSTSSGRPPGRSSACTTRSTRQRLIAATQPSLRELICPVCRTILREPVTLPCTHNLCLRCLRGTVEHNSLSCPLCRQRVGSWLRSATKTESLVNVELWQLIRKRFPEELELAAGGPSDADGAALDLDSVFATKNILSAAGEFKREYEVQLQIAEEEMRRQREKERLANESLIRKIQEEQEQEKLVQLAQNQLLAKTLARREVNNKLEQSIKPSTGINLHKSESNANQSKASVNQKMSAKPRDIFDIRKNIPLISKLKSERYAANSKSGSANVRKETSEVFISQKPVPIHNAVTRVVTHQSRLNHPNNSTYSDALGEVIGSTSKIYGLQSKEELHVPSDVLSSKKKKLGVEVCVTTVKGEERIGSAESAGSHDSINQEIHHFKPIKVLPRTPLRVTLDGRQIDPKLIRVLPILKRVSNAAPKPPTPSHLKKVFGCSWSAFKRISRQQLLPKDSLGIQQLRQQENKKTDKKSLEQESRDISKLSKSLQQELDERNSEVSFDSNKNYTKSMNKIVNGTKVSKKLNLSEHQVATSMAKQSKRIGKLKNGLMLDKYKSQSKESTTNAIIGKTIEVVNIEDDDDEMEMTGVSPPDPLAFTPKCDVRPPSPVLELAMENIAERIKRRKTTRTASNTENVQSAINSVAPAERATKTNSKKISTKGRKQNTKKTVLPVPKPKTKTKTATTTTITSQIKRLAARSSKRPRYTEDSESEDEVVKRRETEANEEQRRLELNQIVELTKSCVLSSSSSPAPRKKPRKNAKPSKKPRKFMFSPTENLLNSVHNIDEEYEHDAIIKEQERLERLAAQEREDRELAQRLQDSFNALERIAGRTRRGVARMPSSVLSEVLQEQPNSGLRRLPKRAEMK